jgi:signal transduction histidine kinase
VTEAPGCHGLRLLRERARLLGGSLVLSARPEGGAALTLTLPRRP